MSLGMKEWIRQTVEKAYGPKEINYVYLAYHQDGTLLYVGVTRDLTARFKAHERQKDWWNKLVNHFELRVFDYRCQAEAQEAKLIRELRPRYNLAGLPPVGHESY